MDISFIIVEYFGIDILKNAVQSILEHSPPATFEIIVVSNSSYTREKQIEIASQFPLVKFNFNQKNVGFGRGVNQGIRKSAGQYVLLLNPDAELLDRSLAEAIQFMDSQKRVAIVGPLIVDSSGKIQDSCREFITFNILFKRIFKRIGRGKSGAVLEDKDYSVAHQIDWVSGACLLARKKAIDDAGLLDERFFMYMEDMDWCRNFWKNGWQVWFLPVWRVKHDAGRSSTGRLNFTNKLMWIHLFSFFKYNMKWNYNRNW